MGQYEIVFSKVNTTCHYKMTAVLKEFELLDKIVVYGIEVCKIGCEGSSLPYERCVINDISSQKEIVKKMIEKMAANNLLPIHTMDAVEDFII